MKIEIIILGIILIILATSLAYINGIIYGGNKQKEKDEILVNQLLQEIYELKKSLPPM